ncbi:unnamed protein product [Ilex paraguariensis]|uniref:Uncharacterized protein n=1 Tax=Ilex paraguariensis TaxID=185542 RepID=A0ABC8UMK7_9AQUA
MALTADVAKHRYNKDLFNALTRGEEDKVIQLCRENPEGPLHVLSLHKDTVLHVATYSKRKDLVLNLLQELPEGQFAKLTHQNDAGNTVLHEAVTSDRTVKVATELLLKAPELLSMHNQNGETALFCAARYGKSKMYEYLDDEMNKSIKDPAELKAFHYRDDKTTILHLSILNEYFSLALLIASKYEYLLNEKDDDGMTALQLLACNPAAFEDRRSTPVSLKRFFYSSQRCCAVPLWESIQKQHRIYEEAVKIAKFLIERDTSWEETESALDSIKPKIHKYSSKNSQDRGVGKGKKAATSTDQTVHQKFAETPLLLATKSGIMEIVEEILTMYPQAVDHVDHNGQNILHRAIKYRQMQVFDLVEKMEIPMRRLTRKIDNNGNSILHCVGKRSQDHEADMRSPALILQEELHLFEVDFYYCYISCAFQYCLLCVILCTCSVWRKSVKDILLSISTLKGRELSSYLGKPMLNYAQTPKNG